MHDQSTWFSKRCVIQLYKQLLYTYYLSIACQQTSKQQACMCGFYGMCELVAVSGKQICLLARDCHLINPVQTMHYVSSDMYSIIVSIIYYIL